MYKPLPDFIDIQDSEIDGKGLFAKQIIKENTNIGISHVMLNDPSIWIRTPVGGFVNHSDKPNCMIVIDQAFTHLYFLFTTEQIMPGEELTVKYNTLQPRRRIMSEKWIYLNDGSKVHILGLIQNLKK